MSEIQKIGTHKPLSIPTAQSAGPAVFEKIEKHLAWHGKISLDRASRLMEYKPFFSYILTSGETPDTYILSYMGANGIVAHAVFERDNNAWLYRNFTHHRCATLDELIPKAMHCKPEECRPLSHVTQAAGQKV